LLAGDSVEREFRAHFGDTRGALGPDIKLSDSLSIPPKAYQIKMHGTIVAAHESVLILMVALWIERPLDFSAFPTVLLVATLLRLALNIATTRLILANGPEGLMAAGYIIGGFSKLVMSGDFVIGLIVFAILITVNFVVISRYFKRIWMQ
jgi:flagellar biosynthesis protein FlhA